MAEGKRIRELGTQSTFDSAMTLAVDKAGIAEALQMSVSLISNSLWVQSGSDISYTTGDVGIGTATPEALLQVSGGDILIDNDKSYLSKTFGGLIRDVLIVTTSDNVVLGNSSYDNVDFEVGTLGQAMRIEDVTGFVGIGTAGPTAKLHIDQNSATGAIPVVLFDQADDSEEMMEFTATIGVGNAIEAVGAKTLTTTHFIKVTITGVGTRYFPVGTIA